MASKYKNATVPERYDALVREYFVQLRELCEQLERADETRAAELLNAALPADDKECWIAATLRFLASKNRRGFLKFLDDKIECGRLLIDGGALLRATPFDAWVNDEGRYTVEKKMPRKTKKARDESPARYKPRPRSRSRSPRRRSRSPQRDSSGHSEAKKAIEIAKQDPSADNMAAAKKAILAARNQDATSVVDG
ncbi:MAG: hypothetical protein KGL39_27650 [Patescibacteria group bacterium]|nr:hypothetical protein [Patescibacteria group bacterium]